MIWDEGIMPLVNWFIGIGQKIWDNGVMPLVNWWLGIGQKIWDEGIIPLVNWFAELPSKLWNMVVDFVKEATGQGKYEKKQGSFEKWANVDIPGVSWATGGIVPSGYNNDTFPANLSTGETVVPTSTSNNLFKLIDSLATGNGVNNSNNETNALLKQLIALIAGQQTTVNVQLDRNVLAKAILTMNNDNRRLA